MIAGLILAAGESSRMKFPKALLKIGDVTFAESIASKMRHGKIDPVFVVAGAHVDEIRERLGTSAGFTIVHNASYSQGQISSLKEGLRHLPAGVQAVMVWPVDQPLIKQETVQALASAFQREQNPVVIPVFEGKHGHPVIYGTAAIHSVLALKQNQTAKELRSIYKDQTLFVEVADPAILIDIDTPEDYRQHLP